MWLPTVDSLNEMTGAHEIAPGAKPPVWMRLQQELRDQGVHIEPVRVVDDGGTLLPETHAVLDSVARHGMVLATGHLNRDEIFAVVDAAVEKGIETIVVTHPEFPAQDIGLEDQARLADRGALLERCFTTPHTGKVTWERVFEAIRSTGPERLGPVHRPRPGLQPARRGRAGDHGRQAAPRRLRRGGDPRDGSDQHAPAGWHRAAGCRAA